VVAKNGRMTHVGEDGKGPADRINDEGYREASSGENIATGYASPVSVMNGWMTSPGHKNNILGREYRHVGLGVAPAPSERLYWAAVFASPATPASEEQVKRLGPREPFTPDGIVGDR